ncbi:Alpha/Beta hydrolase protein [Biscogniauxia mediterranea]|nr:Alpha/Beta hydrolase protein [Biscogniauxia mediterranea]
MKSLLGACLLAATWTGFFSTAAATTLPRRDGYHGRVAHSSRQSQIVNVTVDLGYEVYQGTLDATGSFYKFSNVPYAEQPVGDLRFQKPVAITGQAGTEVNDGSEGEVKCMQAYPEWILELFAGGSAANLPAVTEQLVNASGQTESCLVLDVRVPVNVFNANTTAQAPVLVWIHGGGFTYGSKTSDGDPAGIIARSQADGGEGLIVVSINYRLGLFGWLGGDDDVTPNLGLYDQLVALEWVQQHIGQFGGSPDRVTVMGESAGAASIVHHVTAYGGGSGTTTPAPFQAAIPQSPAFQLNLNTTAAYALTLAAASNHTGAGIRSVADLGALDADELKTINQAVVYGARTGTFNFGPTPDGTYVPKLPQILLLEGQFDRSVNLLISHTANEAVPFTPTDIATAADVRARVVDSFPEASEATLDALLDQVYPDVLNGSADYPWTTEFARAAQIGTDTSFACITRFLATAFENQTHNYIFAYPPAYHAADLPYVFYSSSSSSDDVDAALAQGLQDYIVAFARSGDPNAQNPGAAPASFPAYGADAQVLRLAQDGFEPAVDDMANERCAWIQQALVQGLL